jgi:hypothetical protein
VLCSNCASDLKPVVAVDIDGTLADYHLAFSSFAITYFNMPHPDFPWDGEGEMENYLGITKSQYREAKLAYRQGGNKRWMRMYPGARSFVSDLRLYGAEVWIATSRPWQRLDNIDPDTRFWLDCNGVQFDGMLYGNDKYDQLIQAVGSDRVVGVVDDLFQQLVKAHRLGLSGFQPEREHNSFAACHWDPRGSLYEATEWATQRIDDWREEHE